MSKPKTESTENRMVRNPMKTAEGFDEVTLDLLGFYDFKDAEDNIFFVPIDVLLMDGNIKKEVPAALIRARLTKPCKVKTAVKEGKEIIQANKGDLIGIWYKPGMKAIANCAGVECQMYQAGSMDTGMPTEMLIFKIAKKHGAEGKKLVIAEDRRDKSKGEVVFGLTQTPNKSVTATTEENYDNAPF